MRSDLLDIIVHVLHQTERAALLATEDTDPAGVWVPLSWFEWSEEPDSVPGPAEITISKSRAEEKGLA